MSTLTLPPRSVPKQETAEEEQQKIWDYYEQEVMKAIESDTWTPGTPEFWESLRKKAHERREARKTSAVSRSQ